jgi:hypothetical protein
MWSKAFGWQMYITNKMNLQLRIQGGEKMVRIYGSNLFYNYREYFQTATPPYVFMA